MIKKCGEIMVYFTIIGILLILVNCSSDNETIDPELNIYHTYLIFPYNGQKMSLRTPHFEFKHTNPGTEGIYYEFLLSKSQSFTDLTYYETNIIPDSDRFSIYIENPLDQGNIYYYKVITRLQGSEDFASSAVYHIFIEYIGRNNPNLFLSVGDSITGCAFTGQCYPDFLYDYLITYFGDSVKTVNDGIGGLFSFELLNLIDIFLYMNNPAYTIIMIGVNDIRHPGACPEPYNCGTLENIISIAQRCANYDSIPVVCTLIPVLGYSYNAFDEQIRELNQDIMDSCLQMGYEYIDLYSAIWNYGGDINSLYYDDIHPNVQGNDYIASVIFDYFIRRVYPVPENARQFQTKKGRKTDSIIIRGRRSKKGIPVSQGRTRKGFLQ